MNQADDLHGDVWLRHAAAEFPYPPAPDVRAAVRERLRRPLSTRRIARLAPVWAVFAILLAAASLLLVPQVRASVFALLRAGGMTIFVTEPTPTSSGAPQGANLPGTATVTGDGIQLAFLVPVSPVTLAEAADALGPDVRIPSLLVPHGAPKEVYLHDADDARVAVLVWSGDEDRRYVLYAIAAADFAAKLAESVTTTEVGGLQAYWVDGRHSFALRDGELWDWQTVYGPVLIWTDGALTYRLEGATSPEEAQALADGLRP